MQEDRGKVQEDQRNLGWCHLSLIPHQLQPEASHKSQVLFKNYYNLAMIILFILQGKVSIAASGPADKIHPSSFQQTHEQFGISRIPDTLRIK